MVTSEPGRGLRVDAQRNRDHILQVADEYFAANGVDGSLGGIAKLAGVGAGTLYRHFATKDALLAALLEARENNLVTRILEIETTAADAVTALREWLAAVVEWAGTFEGLPEPLRAAMTAEASPLKSTCEGFITTTEEFLSAAQRDGAAHPEVGARELFLAALAISWAQSAVLADEKAAASMVGLLESGWGVTDKGIS